MQEAWSNEFVLLKHEIVNICRSAIFHCKAMLLVTILLAGYRFTKKMVGSWVSCVMDKTEVGRRLTLIV